MSTKKAKHKASHQQHKSNDNKAERVFNVVADKPRHKYTFAPRNDEQANLVQLMRSKDLVFATGVAGTGKTHVLMAEAVRALKDREVTKIYLARPAVDAGESLGFLPGNLDAKIAPYMLPYLDELSKIVGTSKRNQMIEDGEIEFVSFANIRGRTLGGAFVILDEAQNTTVEQMKTFLTRIGEGARIVVSGDETQSDLPKHIKDNNGLTDALERFKNRSAVGMILLVKVVRSAIAALAVEAYTEEKRAEPVPNLGQKPSRK